jgi:two-component system heavy metal sensor histidine kinase CusS
MRSRSLTATLALAFAGTTLAVFALVGSFVYFALDRQVKGQDDLDIVLVARHTRRLAQELDTLADVRTHAERLTSQVLGNQALSMEVLDGTQQVLAEHNAASMAAAAVPPGRRVGATGRIAEDDIVEWHRPDGAPVRGVVIDAALRDGSLATVIVARDMTDRWRLLDYYRDRLYAAGFAGMLLAFLMSYLLVRESLKPLREIASSAGEITVDKLDTRIAVANVPQELEALVAALNVMLAGLSRSFRRLSQFTADLAHDLRTPLGNLRGSNEVALARPRSSEEYQLLLASNLEECDRLSRMIENVLFLARAEHPQFAKNMREFDVDEELRRIADYFEGVAEDAGVQIRVPDSLRGRDSLTADVELFRRAVSNLLANALRYTPRNGEIILQATASPDRMRVCVANQGSRIDPALLGAIFERFYRVDPSRTSGAPSSGAAGLGLAIVRTIMELHGGGAYAESDASSTRFILEFPRR